MITEFYLADGVKVKTYSGWLIDTWLNEIEPFRKNPSGSLDADAARELELFTENDSDLYRQSEQPIIKNLLKKKKKGTYDHYLATKLWRYHADRGAQKYAKEYGDGREWFKMFNVPTRNKVALDFTDHFETEYALGNYK